MSFWNDLQRRVKRSTSHRHLHNEDDAAVTLDSGNATAGADLSSSEKTSTAALWDANSSGTSRIDGQKVKCNSPRFFRTEYKSLPVSVPANFLAPLSKDAVKRREDVRVERVDFEKVGMMEYKGFYAVVVDGLFDEAECEALIKYAEMSAGGHRNGHGIDVGESQGQGRIGGASFVELGRKKDGSQADDGDGLNVQENGWHTALLRHGQNRERLAIQQRNSQRIIWMNQDIASRIWKRIEGVEDVRSELQSLEGERWNSVIGTEGVRRGERWRVSKEGLSEGLKFLKYGVGGYFREHCDGEFSLDLIGERCKGEEGRGRESWQVCLYVCMGEHADSMCVW